MAKKPRSSGKGESQASGKEETGAPDTELFIPIPESGGRFNFFYVFGGLGVLLSVCMILYIVLHYLLHIL
jgi:hypothetical protein